MKDTCTSGGARARGSSLRGPTAVRWMRRLAILLIAGTLTVRAGLAFKAEGPGQANSHQRITIEALGSFIPSEVLLAIANGAGLPDEALGQVKGVGMNTLHFDDCNFVETTQGIADRYDLLVANIDAAGEAIAWKRPICAITNDPALCAFADEKVTTFQAFGTILHTVQDFYSHSNWAETMAGDTLLNIGTKNWTTVQSSAGDYWKYPYSLDATLRTDAGTSFKSPIYFVQGKQLPGSMRSVTRDGGWSSGTTYHQVCVNPVSLQPELCYRGIVTGVAGEANGYDFTNPQVGCYQNGAGTLLSSAGHGGLLLGDWPPCDQSGISPQGCLSKDTPALCGQPVCDVAAPAADKARYARSYDKAREMAVKQTRWEWCRLVSMVRKAHGNDGVDRLFDQWLGAGDTERRNAAELACDHFPPVLEPTCQDVTVAAGAQCELRDAFTPQSDIPADFVCETFTAKRTRLGDNLAFSVCEDSLGQKIDCSFSLKLVDETPPALDCNDESVFECNDGTGGRTLDRSYSVGFSDNCDREAQRPDCGPSARFPNNSTTPVSCTAQDASGNSRMASCGVTIRDRQPPSLSCPPAPDPVECTGSGGAPVGFAVGPATDACEGSVASTCSRAPGSTFGLGATTVACAATDGTGHSGRCSFEVRVQDTIRPVLTPRGAVSPIECGLGTFVDPGALVSEVCDASIAGRVVAGVGAVNPALVGGYFVTYNVTDSAGNVAAPVTRPVSVVDTTPPSLTCPPDIAVEPVSPAGTAVAFAAASWLDACDPSLSTPTCPLSGGTFGVGSETLAACHVADKTSGPPALSATCTLKVKVLSEQEVVEKLGKAVGALFDAGTVNRGQSVALNRHLRNILDSVASGRIGAACGHLAGWSRQLEGWVTGGVLGSAEAAPLLGSSNNLAAALACPGSVL